LGLVDINITNLCFSKPLIVNCAYFTHRTRHQDLYL